jgi:hypothetical protein
MKIWKEGRENENIYRETKIIIIAEYPSENGKTTKY